MASTKVIKQVEFYFSDNNLPKDKFLTELTSKNEEGWCPIETIASFKRMKQITEDFSVVVNALKESTFLVVSEDGKNVRRKDPLPENTDFLSRSVYLKGLDEKSTLEDVEAWVAKQLKEGEKCQCVRMRRFRGGGERAGDFKGSVFLEFDSEATAKRFEAAEIKLTEDATEPLKSETKANYIARKKAEKKTLPGKEGAASKRKAPEQVEEEPAKEITKDLILSISGLNKESSREDLKEVLEANDCKIGFIEYARTMDSGFVRLAEDSTMLATAAAAKMTEAGVEIKGTKAVFAALVGEEEEAYWKKVGENRVNAKKRHKGAHRGGKRGGKR